MPHYRAYWLLGMFRTSIDLTNGPWAHKMLVDCMSNGTLLNNTVDVESELEHPAAEGLL